MPRTQIEPHKGDKRYVRRKGGKFTKSQDEVEGLEIFDSQGAVLPDTNAARQCAIELATNLGKAKLANDPGKGYDQGD